MSLEKSKYIIYKIRFKNSYLTIFRFFPKYSGLSSIIKIIDFPILLVTYLIFLLRFRSLSLLSKVIRGKLDGNLIEKSIVDHELDILKNFEEFPTKPFHDYLFTNRKDINPIIKLANISQTRWFFQFMTHLLNSKLLEKYYKDSKYFAFIGISTQILKS